MNNHKEELKIMRERIEKLHNTADEILPSFCHNMPCNQECPLWNHKEHAHNDFCRWLNVKEEIDLMNSILQAVKV